MRYALALLILIVPWCSAQTPAPDETGGMLNGRFWSILDTNQKGSYLLGVRDAVVHLDQDKIKQMFPAALALGEFSKIIDSIYLQPENAPIPIVVAMEAARTKADGTVSPEAFERLVTIARGIWVRFLQDQEKARSARPESK